MADISWEDGEDVTWEQGEDVAWEETPSQDLAAKPIEGLGQEKTFLQRAEEAPVQEAPLGQRMMDVTPEKILKAGAVGLEEALPAPTTTLAAGLTSAAESLSQGRPQRPEEIQAAYNRMLAEKEAIKSQAPGIAEVTEGAVGAALPVPTGAGAGARATGSVAGTVAKSLESAAQETAVGATKATAKQLEKVNRYNPELGKFLLDEGIVSAGKSLKGMKDAVAEKLKESNNALNTVYANLDEATGGRTVDVNTVIAKLEEAKSKLSRVHTNDATREALDREVQTLRERYPEGAISAREAQELKSTYGETGYGGKSILPGTRQAPIDRKISFAYKAALEDSAKQAAPEIAEALERENKRASYLKSAAGILSGKKPPELSPVELVAGVGGGLAHPAAAVIPLATQQIRARGATTLAAAERGLSSAAGSVERMLSNPDIGPVVDAAVRAVGLPTVTQIVNQYGEDDPRTRALLTRLASRGE